MQEKRIGVRRKPGPKKPHSANFKVGNPGGKPRDQGGNGGRPIGSVDVVPRRPVVATAMLAVLFNEQLRDPRTGKLSRSKWAKPVGAAPLHDFMRYFARALYIGAYGGAGEATQLATGVVKLSDCMGAHLDDKAPSSAPRVTIINAAPGVPSAEVPPPQAPLSAAEGPYEEIREEDAP